MAFVSPSKLKFCKCWKSFCIRKPTETGAGAMLAFYSLGPARLHCHLLDGLHLRGSEVGVACDCSRHPAVFSAASSLAFCSVNHWAVECWSWNACWHFSLLCWRGICRKMMTRLEQNKDDKRILKCISTDLNDRRKGTDVTCRELPVLGKKSGSQNVFHLLLRKASCLSCCHSCSHCPRLVLWV